MFARTARPLSRIKGTLISVHPSGTSTSSGALGWTKTTLSFSVSIA
ncbi:hypothetical protein LZK73_16370 [Neorhizobium galegae]|nr:hypothetical protein LZK73_16370 [Neorhizobium galegae]